MPVNYLLIIAAALFICFASIAYAWKQNSRYAIFSFLLFNVGMLSAGMAISYLNDARQDNRWFGHSLDKGSVYLARVIDEPAEKAQTWKMPVAVISKVGDGKAANVSGKAFVYLYKDSEPVAYHKGDTVLLSGEWQAIRNAGNPFEFDYAAYCRRNNIHYSQYCLADDISLYAYSDRAAMPLVSKAHDWCMAQLDTYIRDAKTKGLIQAMLLGDEVNLDEELRQSFSETGIIHIIAISGGNVAIFFIVVSGLLWWLKDRKHMWLKYAIALPLVWFYVIMAGAPPSAVRAALMFSLLALGVMLQKNNNSLNQLFATAFLLLCAEPMWLFSIGFQLSFVAVLSLIIFYAPIYKLFSPGNKAARLLWGTVVASIAAEILVAPLVIYYFHTFPVLFIVANVAAYVFMGVVLVLGIAIIVTSFIPAIAGFIGLCTVWLVTIFDKIVVALQRFNPISFRFLQLGGVELTIFYLAIAGIGAFLLRKHRQALFAGMGALCCLMAILCVNEWERLQQHKLVVYNTGRSNHIEMITGSRYAMLHMDTTMPEKTVYAANPSHISWQAWEKGDTVNQEVFTIGGETVLLLNGDVDTGGNFPVDYLVINYPGKQDMKKLRKIFSPRLIVLGGNFSRGRLEKYLKESAENHIAVHAAGKNGAWVLGN
jgi:competence protein ComEC